MCIQGHETLKMTGLAYHLEHEPAQDLCLLRRILQQTTNSLNNKDTCTLR